MAKSKVPSVLEIKSELKSNLIRPVYFIFGEDSFGASDALKAIKNSVNSFIDSDFDKETYYASNCSLSDVITAAKTFPFGGGKKLIVIKNADEFKFSSKDETFISYIKSPSDLTIVIFLYNGKISKIDSEPFRSLLKYNFLFESSELKGEALIKWLIQFGADNKKNISYQDAALLIDIVGENRNILETQLEKIFEFVGESNEISFNAIEQLASKLKTYTIFDLFNAIDKRDQAESLKIVYNLLNNSELGIIGIIAMLNKHFTALLRIDELEKSDLSKDEKAKITGTHHFYYKGLVDAARLYGYKGISKALESIYTADIRVKSSSLDEKTILTILIAEILSE
jgi:DNA polymerase-3 subunit delta